MKTTINKTILTLALAGIALATTGCAIKSVDKYGNECVVGQTCEGLLTTKPYTNRTIEGATVIGVHKPGSAVWENAIRTTSLQFNLSQEELRAEYKDKDFVQTRKMGFMYAINHHGGLMANDLAVGDVIDVVIGDKPYDVRVGRVVKRAGNKADTQATD